MFVCRALPGYNYMRDFTPAVVIAPYGSGAWGAADLCAAGQCRDKAMFETASWIWSEPLPTTGAASLYAYCRLSLGVSSVVIVDPPAPPATMGPNDFACGASSSSSCAELGWPVRRGTGFDTVCAASQAVGCVSGATFAQAQGVCVDIGGRLCTADEILAHVTQGSGCSFDSQRIWTTDRTALEQECGTNAYVTMKGAKNGLLKPFMNKCSTKCQCHVLQYIRVAGRGHLAVIRLQIRIVIVAVEQRPGRAARNQPTQAEPGGGGAWVAGPGRTFLPRQARDKHRENSFKRLLFCAGTGVNTGLVGDWPIMCTPVDEQASVRCCADTAPADAGCSCPSGSWHAKFYRQSLNVANYMALADPDEAPEAESCQLGDSAGGTISYQWGAGGPEQLPGAAGKKTRLFAPLHNC